MKEGARRRLSATAASLWDRSEAVEHVNAGLLMGLTALQASARDLKLRPWALSQSSTSVAVKEPTPGSARSSSRV